MFLYHLIFLNQHLPTMPRSPQFIKYLDRFVPTLVVTRIKSVRLIKKSKVKIWLEIQIMDGNMTIIVEDGIKLV